MKVHFQPLTDELPYEWNVAVYWDEDRGEFCLQVLKKKGIQLTVDSWQPELHLFYAFSEYERGAIDSVIYPRENSPKIFSAGRFAKFIDDYKPLKPLAKIINDMC